MTKFSRSASGCCWRLLAVTALITLIQVHASDFEHCIAEKYYRFAPSHTACVTKSSSASSSGVSAADKKLIVDRHNELRAQEDASNMQKMVWDDELAAIAQRWTDNCKFKHDKERRIPGRFSVGQNLAAGRSSWKSTVEDWYNEKQFFTFGNQSANIFSKVGHYTQVVWAKSAKIGCGYTHCSQLKYKHFYACNYAPAGNAREWYKPYELGTKCGKCPNKCSEDGLCDCEGKVCENGGTLDLNTCQCTCLMSWNLPETCAMNCDAVNEPWYCAPGSFYDGKCFIYSNVPYACPKLCNVCPYSGVGYQSP